jgi:hypothetical protein
VQKYITAFDDDGRGMEQANAAEARGTTLAEHLISLRLGIPNPMVSVIIRYRYVPRSAAMRLAGRTVVAGLSSGRFHRALMEPPNADSGSSGDVSDAGAPDLLLAVGAGPRDLDHGHHVIAVLSHEGEVRFCSGARAFTGPSRPTSTPRR